MCRWIVETITHSGSTIVNEETGKWVGTIRDYLTASAIVYQHNAHEVEKKDKESNNSGGNSGGWTSKWCY